MSKRIFDAMESVVKQAEEHVCKKELKKTAIGGNINYSVTPTSIGVFVTAACVCGYQLDNLGEI